MTNPLCARAAPSLLTLLLVVNAAHAASIADAALQHPHSPQGTLISPAVMLLGRFDWEVSTGSDGTPWSRCIEVVRRAAATGSDRVNIVPTHHWLPANDGGVRGFCAMHGDNGKHSCLPWSDQLIGVFRAGMTECFKEALNRGLHIAIKPHLDDGTGKGAWRNGLVFTPATKYGAYSYADIMLYPVADAITAALAMTGRYDARIWLAMQGEMSATIMRQPRDWAAMVPLLRERAGAGGRAKLSIGIGLNFNRLDDTSSTNQRFGASRLSWLMWAVGASDRSSGGGVPPIDSAGVKELFTQKLDFIGISAYAPYTGPGMSMNEFGNAAFMFADSIKPMGMDLGAMLASGLELHYAEFGLGGGQTYGGTQMATTPSAVALRPFFGIYGPYSQSNDPWRIPANRGFLREFYSKLCTWLADPGNKTYRISDVYIWSMASWDVLGMYPESTTGEGSYRDEEIARMIALHNKAVLGAKSGGASNAPKAQLG